MRDIFAGLYAPILPVAGFVSNGYIVERGRINPAGLAQLDYATMDARPVKRAWWKAPIALALRAPTDAADPFRRNMGGLMSPSNDTDFPGGAPIARDEMFGMDNEGPQNEEGAWMYGGEQPFAFSTERSQIGPPLRTTGKQWWKAPIPLAFHDMFAFRPDRNTLEREPFNPYSTGEELPYSIYRNMETNILDRPDESNLEWSRFPMVEADPSSPLHVDGESTYRR